MDKNKLEDFIDKVFTEDSAAEQFGRTLEEVILKEGVVLNDEYFVPSGTEIIVESNKLKESDLRGQLSKIKLPPGFQVPKRDMTKIGGQGAAHIPYEDRVIVLYKFDPKMADILGNDILRFSIGDAGANHGYTATDDSDFTDYMFTMETPDNSGVLEADTLEDLFKGMYAEIKKFIVDVKNSKKR
jgi:hypothetical protein